jgi:hypothetical protein
MRRRTFLIRLGGAIVAVPALLELAACDAEVGDHEPYAGIPPAGGAGGGATGQSFTAVNEDDSGHSHSFLVQCSHRGQGGWVYTATGAHSHQVRVSDDDLAAALVGQVVTLKTTDLHPHNWVLRKPAEVVCAPPPSGGSFSVMNSDGSGHLHSFTIECSHAGAGGRVYIAGGAHTHAVELTAAELAAVFAGQQVTVETTDLHPHTWVIVLPGATCG